MKKQNPLLRNKANPVYRLGIKRCIPGLFFYVRPPECRDVACRVSTVRKLMPV